MESILSRPQCVKSLILCIHILHSYLMGAKQPHMDISNSVTKHGIISIKFQIFCIWTQQGITAIDVCSAPNIWETMDVLMVILCDSKIKMNDLSVWYFTNNA